MKTIYDAGSISSRKRDLFSNRNRQEDHQCQENVERIRQSAVRSPKKSIARRSLELQIPKTTIHKVLRKRLQLCPYKIQLLQELKPTDNEKRFEFATTILDKIVQMNRF